MANSYWFSFGSITNIIFLLTNNHSLYQLFVRKNCTIVYNFSIFSQTFLKVISPFTIGHCMINYFPNIMPYPSFIWQSEFIKPRSIKTKLSRKLLQFTFRWFCHYFLLVKQHDWNLSTKTEATYVFKKLLGTLRVWWHDITMLPYFEGN